jgi:hypothetical protein
MTFTLVTVILFSKGSVRGSPVDVMQKENSLHLGPNRSP